MSQSPAPASLIVTPSYWPEKPGIAPVATDLAEWLAAQGAEVEVATQRPHYPEMTIYEEWRGGARDYETRNGVAIRRTATAPAKGGGAAARLKSELVFARGLGSLARRGVIGRRPAVVATMPAIFAARIATRLKATRGRAVCIVYDIPSGLAGVQGSGGVKGAVRRLENAALKRFDAIVTLTEGMAADLRGRGLAGPIHVLPPQVDCARVTPRPRPEGAPPTLLYSGNLGRKQGLGQLIDLAAELARRAPEARIVVRGEGVARADLEDAARARGLGNFMLEGFAPDERFAEAMADGDVHLVPQLAEGANFALPSKVFSIMAAGRPFVATAPPETPLGRLAAASGAGHSTPPNDAAAFAEACVTLLNDEPRRAAMGAAARAYALKHADREVVLARIAAIMRGPA